MNYYNEHDPKAAAWLRALIDAGHIAPGIVDTRSISDVQPDELTDYAQCHFFAGIGGWSYALRLAGWADAHPVWTGSPPCQPFSVAGKRKAQSDARHLWPVFFNLIRECQPAIIFGEQVEAAIRTGWLDDLQDDLEAQNYACGKIVLPACSVGAPHIRQRIWFVAERLADTQPDGSQRRIFGRENPQRRSINRSIGCNGTACEFCGYEFDIELLGKYGCPNCEGCGLGDTEHDGPHGTQMPKRTPEAGNQCQTGQGVSGKSQGTSNTVVPGNLRNWENPDWLYCRDDKWRPVEPGTFPLANGIPERVGLLRGYGNAIVPLLAAEFVSAWIDCSNASHQP